MAKKRANKYEEKVSYDGSFEDLMKLTFKGDSMKRGEWHFKSGRPTPIIEPKYYVLTSIVSKGVNVDTIGLQLSYYKSDAKHTPRLIMLSKHAKLGDLKKESAKFIYPLDLIGSEEPTLEVKLIDNTTDYDFTIYYEARV